MATLKRKRELNLQKIVDLEGSKVTIKRMRVEYIDSLGRNKAVLVDVAPTDWITDKAVNMLQDYLRLKNDELRRQEQEYALRRRRQKPKAKSADSSRLPLE